MTNRIDDTEMLSASELLQGFLSTASKAEAAGVRMPESAQAVRAEAATLGRTTMCENTGPMVNPDDAAFMTGRGPTGRCRNFRQMSDGKLLNVLYDVRQERNDDYAFDALVAEATSRGLRF
jgi:hypothetical protein